MASLTNSYPNLPGMLVEFKDGGKQLKFDQTEANTDSVLLLGTAVDGPVMEPVAVDENTVELIFGSETKDNGSPNGSTLVHGFKQVAAAGCKDIRLMRISGSQAEARMGAKDKKETINTRVDKDLSIVQGCDETIIELQQQNVLPDTIKVFAGGITLENGYTYDRNSNKLTIAKNACDAGVSIGLSYDYEATADHDAEDLVLDAERSVTLDKVPVANSVIVTYTDADKAQQTVDPAQYSVRNNVITFTTDVPLNTNDYVTVSYKVTTTYSTTEQAGTDGTPYRSNTSDEVLLIEATPAKDTLTLYIDDAKVLDTNAYTVNYDAKTISIKKDYFRKGQKISVSFFVSREEKVKREIVLKSAFGGSIYNTGLLEVVDQKDALGETIGKIIRITEPITKSSAGSNSIAISSIDVNNFGELVEAINAAQSTYVASTECPEVSIDELEKIITHFRDGSDGLTLTNDEKFKLLSGERDKDGYLTTQGAYQLLENYIVDWVVPLGVYADDELQERNENFAYELALFCAVLSYRNKATYGAIAMKPLKDTSLAGVQSHAKYLKNYNNEFLMKDTTGSVITDSNGDTIDLGKYITLVPGPTPLINHPVNALREANPAAMYVGFNSTLLPQSAPTNKKLTGSTGIKYNFSNSQLNDIVGNRMAPLGIKYSRTGSNQSGAYVIDGPTCARVGSEYARLTTMKVVREVADQCRDAADPFIGEANTIEQRNALSAAISKRLDLLLENGVILDYSFNLVATAQDQLLGQANLELGIVAPEELRRINTVIGLKRS